MRKALLVAIFIIFIASVATTSFAGAGNGVVPGYSNCAMEPQADKMHVSCPANPEKGLKAIEYVIPLDTYYTVKVVIDGQERLVTMKNGMPYSYIIISPSQE